ncbi:MAG: ABC transporter permease [Imperialibacter sp.]|uniref:ABC transporter permease n=1 Tax=Imperialibacter sp. TaxID=2038411 RepID=UPI0032ED42D6
MNKHNPPRLPLRFFRWFCHPEYREDIEGDLLERFDSRVVAKGPAKASWLFSLDVVRLFRPTIIKPMGGTNRMSHLGMLNNYMKVGWRSMLRHKLYTIINVGGLTLGLTAFILIFLYIRYELSYDRFYPNADKIYRAYEQEPFNPYMGSDYFAVTPAGLAVALENEYPEVQAATSFQTPTTLVGHGEDHYLEKGLSASPSFFNVFHYEFLQGNPSTALQNPESIVLTESLAYKIFGRKEAMGERLSFGDRDVIVTGVIKDPPTNASIKFSHVTSLAADTFYVEEITAGKWRGSSFHTFLTLTDEGEAVALESKMPALVKKYWAFDDYPNYFIQPIADVHLQTNVNFDIGAGGSPNQLLLFSLVAGFILVLACINYMNLAIARSIRRAKEVGLRKVIGAHKWQLIVQFLAESVFVTLMALVLAVVLLPMLLPYFGDMVDRQITIQPDDLLLLAPGLLLLVIFVGALAGSYPAFFMSSLMPVAALKGSQIGKPTGAVLQRWLIIGQYAVSIAMIICSVVVYSQFRFISGKGLGFDKEHVLTIRLYPGPDRKALDAIENEWRANPNVLGITKGQNLPTNIDQSEPVTTLQREQSDPDTYSIIYQLRTDANFLDVFGMQLVTGRTLSEEYALDKSSENCLLNEAACKAFGLSTDSAVGKTILLGWGGKSTVVGVLQDFHMHSMHLAIEPLMVQLRQNYRYISVKIRPDDLPETVAELEATFNKYSDYPFDYQFLDEKFDELYKADVRQGKLFGLFTAISLIIACLGLFGLAAFSTQQRAKEVGVRKVLGASISHIVALFASRFVKMVMIGYVIALPVGWWLIDHWLQEFAYRVTVEWWMLALPGLAAVAVAFLTISSQSARAAMANPVDSLRTE